jgi:hypothetical protein
MIASIFLALANFAIYFFNRDSSDQIIWICFVLVWLDLVLSWLTYRRLENIAYLFLATALLLELLTVVDIYWVSSRYL